VEPHSAACGASVVLNIIDNNIEMHVYKVHGSYEERDLCVPPTV